MITQQTVLDGIREVARDREVITYPPLWDWLEHHFGLTETELNETWGQKSYNTASGRTSLIYAKPGLLIGLGPDAMC